MFIAKKIKSGVIIFMVIVLVFGISGNSIAAGKTVNSYKNNSHSGRDSDARFFLMT